MTNLFQKYIQTYELLVRHKKIVDEKEKLIKRMFLQKQSFFRNEAFNFEFLICYQL